MLRYFSISLGIIGLFLITQPLFPQSAKNSSTKPSNSPHLVKVETLTLQPFSVAANYLGQLRAKRMLRVYTQEAGRLIFFPYDLGDQVKPGQQLAGLEDTLLQAELTKALAIQQQAEIKRERLEKLFKKQLVAEDSLLEAQTTEIIAGAEVEILKTRIGYTKIYVPFEGIIVERRVELGDIVSNQTHILTLIDPNSLVIELAASEYFLSQLYLKQPVEIHIEALENTSFKGIITRLPPTIHETTRLGQLEITLTPLPKGALAGQTVQVTFQTQSQSRLAVPYQALRQDQKGEYVWVLEETKQVRKQVVRSGLQLADRVEIVEGLQAGQLIVTKGFLGLEPDKIVKVTD